MEKLCRPLLPMDASRESLNEPHLATSLFPRHREKIAAWTFNGGFGRHFEILINLQMWCFGCDIRREEGNLLIEYGFERHRPSPSAHGSSHYVKKLPSGHTVRLWGFGVIISDDRASLCFRRFERIPRVSHEPLVNSAIFRPHELPEFHEPRDEAELKQASSLLHALVAELERYEHFVLERAGALFRSRCVQTAPRGARLKGSPALALLWRLLHF